MAPKTRATTERKEGKRKKKERTSFTDDLNPFSPLLQPPLQPSLPSRSPTLTPPSPPKSPLLPCPAASPPLIPLLLPSPSPSPSSPPSPNLALSFITMSSCISLYMNWPHQRLSPVKLAAAGFYRAFSNKKDRVECAFCGVECYGWGNKDYSIKEIMLLYEDDCVWLELRADFYNYLPLLTPLSTVTPCIPDKTLTPIPTPTPTPTTL